MIRKSLSNIYEALLVFIIISSLIMYATAFENNSLHDFSKTTKKQKMGDTCYLLYDAGYFYTDNASYLKNKIQEYAPQYLVDVVIKNATDNSIISSERECENRLTKYCVSYLLSSQYENSSVYDPVKTVVCGC
ncbi:MAG: hypothetical protein KAR87_04105 [Candidatus Aenigmarchaeota archaeon]|nr:hypothetical protein [Candidatus Aenigmarchaeota archaeon]